MNDDTLDRAVQAATEALDGAARITVEAAAPIIQALGAEHNVSMTAFDEFERADWNSQRLAETCAELRSVAAAESALADRLAEALRWYTGQGGDFSALKEPAAEVLAAYDVARRG